MTPATVEFLKWFVGVPAAVAAVVTLPFIMRKYHLECRKLSLEIENLERQAGYITPSPKEQRSRLFIWFARYWALPCYVSLVVCVGLAYFFRSGGLAGAGIGSSLIFLVWGSAVEEHYQSIKASKQ